jgi:hypothetical protein
MQTAAAATERGTGGHQRRRLIGDDNEHVAALLAQIADLDRILEWLHAMSAPKWISPPAPAHASGPDRLSPGYVFADAIERDRQANIDPLPQWLAVPVGS